MARPLPSIPIQNLSFLPMPVTILLVLIAIFSVFSIVTFLCAKKLQRKKEQSSMQLVDKKLVSRVQSNLSSKALLMVKMISWRKVQDGEEEEEELYDDEAVWRRTIIMGERCRPLDFSGKILYDSQGNLLPNSSSHQSGGNNLVSS